MHKYPDEYKLCQESSLLSKIAEEVDRTCFNNNALMFVKGYLIFDNTSQISSLNPVCIFHTY